MIPDIIENSSSGKLETKSVSAANKTGYNCRIQFIIKIWVNNKVKPPFPYILKKRQSAAQAFVLALSIIYQDAINKRIVDYYIFIYRISQNSNLYIRPLFFQGSKDWCCHYHITNPVEPDY